MSEPLTNCRQPNLGRVMIGRSAVAQITPLKECFTVMVTNPMMFLDFKDFDDYSMKAIEGSIFAKNQPEF